MININNIAISTKYGYIGTSHKLKEYNINTNSNIFPQMHSFLFFVHNVSFFIILISLSYILIVPLGRTK